VTPKPVIRRQTAVRDVESIIDHYLGTGGAGIALGFIAALEEAVSHIASHPGTGSPRYGHRLDIPGLRAWPLNRFPYLVFYFDAGPELEIWRVLHGAMDIPEWLDH
jgi:toxin ParE1/3/4